MKVTGSFFYRLLAFVIPVTVIVYFLPRADEHHYIYEVNRPWSYSLLTAPFDIPVNLDSVSAARVTDSITSTLEPVYERNMVMEKTNINEFAERLKSTPDLDITHSERNQLIGELKAVYDNGIVDYTTYARIASDSLPSVKFVHDNVAVSMPTAAFKSQRMAYAHIDSVFRDPRFRAVLSATKLTDLIVPNITYDSTETDRMLTELLRKALAPKGVIQQGERIIDEGDVVTPRLYTVLRTYEQTLSEKNTEGASSHYYPIAGQILYLVIVFGTLFGYLYYFRPGYFRSTAKMVFIMLTITIFALFTFTMNSGVQNGIYIVPCTMVPIMILIYLDGRTALFCHTVNVLVCALVCTGPLEFIFLQFIAGSVAIQTIKELTRRSQLVRAAVFVFLAYCMCYVAIRLLQMGSIKAISLDVIGCFAINAVIVSFTYVLILVFEKLFGFTSKVTLVELSDINNPLLRELSEECPGTFQHSMAVSNLASAAAAKVGANVQLVRTGALYHDIGKLGNPAFFTENQHGVNPHDTLDPIQSARIVVGHVTEGLRRAEKAKLPQVVRNFISEHHGRGTARYFYATYCNQHPDEDVDRTLFSYPGPNPRSKETSILMMADAVEASSRSLTDHSPQAIATLVNRIIDTQISEGLHNDSPLSFADVKEIKETFISRLRTMFHTRISYPEEKNRAAESEDGAQTAETEKTPVHD